MQRQNEKKQNDDKHFLSLPKDIICEIATRYLPTQDAAHLAEVCKFFRQRIQPSLNHIAAAKLLQHVVRGEEDQAQKMLKANPALLLIEATAVDYSGRTIQDATAFQAALGAGDAAMARMMLAHFNGLENGDRVRKEQYDKQFPRGLEQEADYDFDGLVNVISSSTAEEVEAQLKHETRDSALCAAIAGEGGFRERFKPGIVTTGHHFNAQNLIKAFEVYNKKYDDWTDERRDLFWRQVIGFIQRLLPACDAQAFAQGLYHIVEANERRGRSFEFRNDGGQHIFPLTGLALRLGFDYAVCSWPSPSGLGRCRGAVEPLARLCLGCGLGVDLVEVAPLLSNFTQQKHQIIRSFTGPDQRHESGWCVIC